MITAIVAAVVCLMLALRAAGAPRTLRRRLLRQHHVPRALALPAPREPSTAGDECLPDPRYRRPTPTALPGPGMPRSG